MIQQKRFRPISMMQEAVKVSQKTPNIKKHTIDTEELSNFWPVIENIYICVRPALTQPIISVQIMKTGKSKVSNFGIIIDKNVTKIHVKICKSPI